jgi:hypothetical protein
MYKCIKTVKFFNDEVLFIEGFNYEFDSFEDGIYYMIAENGFNVPFEDDFQECYGYISI